MDGPRRPLAEIVSVDELVARFPADAVMVVLATASRCVGRDEIARFLSSPAGGSLDVLAVVRTGANREPALAVYRFEPDAGVYRAHGIFVLSDGALADVVAFPDPGLFHHFGLPDVLGQCPTTKV